MCFSPGHRMNRKWTYKQYLYILFFYISSLFFSGCLRTQPSASDVLPARMGIFLVEENEYVLLNQGNSNLLLAKLPVTPNEQPEFAVIGLGEHLPFIKLHAIEENGFGNEVGFAILLQDGYAQIKLDSSIKPGLYCFASNASLGEQTTLTWCFMANQELLELDKFEPLSIPFESGLHLILEDSSEQLTKQSTFILTDEIPSTNSNQPIVSMNMVGVSVTQLQLVKIIAGLGFTFNERDDLMAVGEIREQSSAGAAGLETGDVFIKIDEQPVPLDKALFRDLIVGEPGTTINLTILRENKILELEASRNTILEYIPIAIQFVAKEDYLLLAPFYPLSSGMYCYVSGVILQPEPSAEAYWCFHVN